MLTIEYLITIKQEDDFCKNERSFLNFLCVDTSLMIKENGNTKTMIDKSSNIEVRFDIVCDEIPTKKERVFNLKMLTNEESKIKEFNNLARKIKKIILKINPGNTQIHTIQNDIGTHFATKAYPIIHIIENSLRKLISKFMILKVGTNWFKESVHFEMIKDLNRNKSDVFIDYLYNLDFIALSDVLFKPYRSISLVEFDNLISNAKSIADIDFNIVQDYIPKSNWERHFSKIVQIDEKTFREKWSKLYNIRNEVAHNRYLTQGNFEELQNLVNSIQPNIDKALDNVDRIKLTDDDIELISQNSFNSTKSYYPRLLAAAKEFNVGKSVILELLESEGFQTDDIRPSSKLTEEMYNILKINLKNDKLSKQK